MSVFKKYQYAFYVCIIGITVTTYAAENKKEILPPIDHVIIAAKNKSVPTKHLIEQENKLTQQVWTNTDNLPIMMHAAPFEIRFETEASLYHEPSSHNPNVSIFQCPSYQAPDKTLNPFFIPSLLKKIEEYLLPVSTKGQKLKNPITLTGNIHFYVYVLWNNKKDCPAARIVSSVIPYSDRFTEEQKKVACIVSSSLANIETPQVTKGNFKQLLSETETHLKSMGCHGVILKQSCATLVNQFWHKRGYKNIKNDVEALSTSVNIHYKSIL